MTQSMCRRTVRARRAAIAAAAIVMTVAGASGARAQALGYASDPRGPSWADRAAGLQEPAAIDNGSDSYVLPERLRRQVVSYNTRETPGTVVIDTANTVLYYVLGHGQAIRYGVGVGRQGFTWAGTQNISRKAEWPDWHPPAEMIARQPYLPRFMAGGPGNPLGARAMYLGASEYRIHGTNDPSTIGKFVSSGCIRLTNADVEDLFNRVSVGTRVVVLPKSGTPRIDAQQEPAKRVPPALQRQAVNQAASGLY